jgi:hypothetical protein
MDELLATPELKDRTKFFDYCRKISPDGIICLASAGLIIQKMITIFSRDANSFDWTQVPVGLKAYEDAIARFEDIVEDEELSAEQRSFAEKTNTAFEEWFSKLRPELQEIYKKAGRKPHGYADVLRLAQEEGGIFWGFAKELYRTAQEWNFSPDGPDPEREGPARMSAPGDDTIKKFVSSCPPFRCVVLAFILTWYDRSVREADTGPRFKAGRVDQFMSAYLPYFPQFITNDGPQRKCLQEVAYVCSLNTQVRLYDDFYNGFLVMGKSA